MNNPNYLKLGLSYDKVKQTVSRIPKDKIKNYYGIGNALYEALTKNDNNLAQINGITREKETFKSLCDKSIRCALKMTKLGIKHNDIVVVVSDDNFDVPAVLVASQLIGAILAPTDKVVPHETNRYILNQLQPKIIFLSDCEPEILKIKDDLNLNCKIVSFDESSNYEQFHDFINDSSLDIENFIPYKTTNMEEIIFISYSSGTQSLKPRGSLISQRAVLTSVENFNTMHINVASVYSEIFWTLSLKLRLAFIINNVTIVLLPKFNMHNLWKSTEEYEVNYLLVLTGTLYTMLKQPPKAALPLVKFFRFSNEAVGEVNLQPLVNIFPNADIQNLYGATEMGTITMFLSGENPSTKIDACGYPMPGCTIKIVDPETKKPQCINKVGEIRVKTEWMFSGYYKDDRKDYLDEEGFFKIKDYGYFDDDFCLYVTGRLEDTFKYVMWRIEPLKIETILNSHPAVKEAAVVGIPHDDLDNIPMGIVVLNDAMTVTPEELIAFVNNQVEERYELKAGLKIVSVIPKTTNMKIKRGHILKLVMENKI